MRRADWPSGYFGPETVADVFPNLNIQTTGPESGYLTPCVQRKTAIELLRGALRISRCGEEVDIWSRWVRDCNGLDQKRTAVLRSGTGDEKAAVILCLKLPGLPNRMIVPELNDFTMERMRR